MHCSYGEKISIMTLAIKSVATVKLTKAFSSQGRKEYFFPWDQSSSLGTIDNQSTYPKSSKTDEVINLNIKYDSKIPIKESLDDIKKLADEESKAVVWKRS